ncbi:hypothetical protein G5B35_08400 [Parapusillimonas sp. SGNA-6]|nr:hypothetical protein [Parapusillimonas sp. SGNA-6]
MLEGRDQRPSRQLFLHERALRNAETQARQHRLVGEHGTFVLEPMHARRRQPGGLHPLIPIIRARQ